VIAQGRHDAGSTGRRAGRQFPSLISPELSSTTIGAGLGKVVLDAGATREVAHVRDRPFSGELLREESPMSMQSENRPDQRKSSLSMTIWVAVTLVIVALLALWLNAS
jgi:cobalamin biosynthesis Mg chelatase CobN